MRESCGDKNASLAFAVGRAGATSATLAETRHVSLLFCFVLFECSATLAEMALPDAIVGLLHQLFDVHRIDRRLAVAVALKVHALAVGLENRRHRFRIAGLVLAQRALALRDAQEQQQRGNFHGR